jgi:putative ABC transport system permease protein
MNKYLQYFKQARNIIRQEKLFSSIYIVGTGLSITVVMVLSIVFYIKIANIYPETNRDRLLVVESVMVKDTKSNAQYGSSLSYGVVETCFFSLESAETVSTTMGREEGRVQPEGSGEQWPVTIKNVDTNFWTVFPFHFVDGKPFTEADMQSGIQTAVIAESLARRLFGTTNATGRTVSLDFRPYRVCGVVRDASSVTKRTYAQLWIPYSATNPDYRESFGPGGLTGSMSVYILAPSAASVEQVRQEAIANVNRYNQTLDGLELSILGQPDRQWQSIFRSWSLQEPEFGMILCQHVLIFFILLLVPAVSLSGMTDSRMERRMTEIGIRRAFGARISGLMTQIIAENLLFTLIGGVVGLLSSYVIILLGRNWIMEIGQTFVPYTVEGTEVILSPAMLLNLPVFAIALAICFTLNLLSSLIPAWRNARREIIHSLNAKP